MFVLEELPESREDAVLYLRGKSECGIDEWELCMYLIHGCSDELDDDLRF